MNQLAHMKLLMDVGFALGRGDVAEAERIVRGDAEPFGHCDTCGAALLRPGICPADSGHEVALPGVQAASAKDG